MAIRNKQFLNTPLWNSKEKKAWKECCDKALPFAVFRKGRKYGEYYCDLLPVQGAGFHLTKEGQHEIRGILEATFTRWYLDKKLPKSRQTIVFSDGPTIISVAPVPAGEEVYIHQAICRVFSKHLVVKSDGEVACQV